MSITLKKITIDNLDDVLKLEIHEEQKEFVSSTAISLAQAYAYYDTAFPFAIYENDTLIGFIMFGFYTSRNQYTLWKFLIDKHFQNKGYGKSALMLGIAHMKQCFDMKEMYTGVIVNNLNAKRLYESCGFIKTGLIENGMEEMVLSLDK